MSEIERIRGFLRSVRRRATVEASLRWLGATLAAALAVTCALAFAAARVGPASFWPKLTGTVLTIVTLLGVSSWLFGPLRRLRTFRAVAVFVGRRRPHIASDLVSAIELSESSGVGAFAPAPTPVHAEGAVADAPGTTGFLRAFFTAVADATLPLDVRHLVPMRPAAIAGGALGGTLVLAGALTFFSPGVITRGLGFLTHEPTRFDGAAISTEPLLADVSLSYTYPPHTHLPPRTVEGSTGDVVAPRGTKVKLEGRLLRHAREVALLLGESGEGGEVPVEVADGRIIAHFALNRSDVFRLWLSPLLGRPVREDRGHRMIAEADQPPQGRDLRAGRPTRARDAAPDRGRLHGKRRLRPWCRRARLPGRGRQRAAHPPARAEQGPAAPRPSGARPHGV